MHRLPDFEVPLKLDVRVWRLERLGLRGCLYYAAVDDRDDAAAPLEIVGQGG